MQKVPVPVIPNSDCEEMYKEAGYIEHIPNIFICAGYQGGKQDSCEVSIKRIIFVIINVTAQS